MHNDDKYRGFDLLSVWILILVACVTFWAYAIYTVWHLLGGGM